MKIRKLSPHVLAITALLAANTIALAQPARNSGQTLEGAWSVAVHFAQQGLPSCAPAPAVISSDGNVIAASCYASEGTGYGSWTRTGYRQFAVTFIGNSFGPGGVVASNYKVRAQVTLRESGDVFSGPFKTDILDLAGKVVMTLNGTIQAKRVEVEPLN